MKIKSLIFTVVLSTTILFFSTSGVSAGVLTSDQIQAVINLLQVFGVDSVTIANVQVSLNGGTPTIPTPPTNPIVSDAWCHTFNTNLGYANSGSSEVGQLHTALQKQGISYGTDTSNQYGQATMLAVVAFQEKYASEVLIPYRLSRGTGYFGSSTRVKLNVLYGCVILPSTCTPNWTCSWGSCTNGYQSQVAVDSNNCGVTTGQIACTALARQCSTPQSSITVTSPNGGEQLVVARPSIITWNTTGFSSSDAVSISLYDSSKYCSSYLAGCWTSFPLVWDGVKNIGSYTWDTNTYYGDPGPNSPLYLSKGVSAGKVYKIKLSIIGSNGKNATDESDNYFSIISPIICTPNWTCGSWSTCTSNTQSRTCTDSNNCGVETNKSATTQSCTPTRTPNWQIGSWSICQNNQQTRTVTDLNNCNVTANSPPITQPCNSQPLCTSNDWTYTLSPTTCPSSSQQTKYWSKIGSCTGGTTHPASETVYCNYQTPTCTAFTYSAWSSCSPSGTQSRTVLVSSPSGCQGGSPVVTQSCTYIAGDVKGYGAFGDGQSHPITQSDINNNPQWSESYNVGDQWDTVAIQESINRGTEVVIPQGDYLIYRRKDAVSTENVGFHLRSNVTIRGYGASLRNTKNELLILKHDYSSLPVVAFQNVVVESVNFTNIAFEFYGRSSSNIANIKFYKCGFSGGAADVIQSGHLEHNDHYLKFGHVNGFQVEECSFIRNAGYIGRGIKVFYSQDGWIKDSVFSGWLITAINVYGRSDDIHITNNNIQRSEAFYNNIGGGFEGEDHGIYVDYVSNIYIEDSFVSGWSDSSSGGSIKARNGDNFTIRNNNFKDSGILLYTYASTDYPDLQHLKNIFVENNTINIRDAQACTDNYHGIGYLRDFGTASDRMEESITIKGNIVTNGCIRIISAYGPAFTVTNNQARAFVFPSTVISSGNIVGN